MASPIFFRFGFVLIIVPCSAFALQSAFGADAGPSLPFSVAIQASHSAAEASLATFAKQYGENHGNGAPEANFRLGSPLPVIELPVDELKQTAGESVRNALADLKTNQVVYPIVKAGEENPDNNIASSLTLFGSADKEWKTSGYANKNLTKLLLDARDKYRDAHHLRDSDFYEVAIPGLGLFFVATGQADDARLIAITDSRKIGVAKDQELRTPELVPKIVAAVNAGNRPSR